MKEETDLSQMPDAARANAAWSDDARDTSRPVTGKTLLDAILASLEDDKAEDIVTIPLKGKSTMADHMVICSGRSTRQVAAIADKLTDRLKQNLGVLSRVEGKDQGDWVLIDTGDVIVHVLRPEVRDFYQLEKLWMTPPTTPAPTSA
ncbi:ribosome silencing factor [Maritimibacter fusiformis]|uniref:Ribosomal silencing factor RsfS n=1 Tax=Maritimibacter fusiformis TaxID=2603819 RepID=A0A5D0R808_9RHOB|nr:ribosome silencing factor [Maritimibacter fusiformis]TYB77642.1 ribosome silencing factor [Maritimibacter fusiformis]